MQCTQYVLVIVVASIVRASQVTGAAEYHAVRTERDANAGTQGTPLRYPNDHWLPNTNSGRGRPLKVRTPGDPFLAPFQGFCSGEGFSSVTESGLVDGIVQTGSRAGLQFWGCSKFDGPWGVAGPRYPHFIDPSRNAERVVTLEKKMLAPRVSLAFNITVHNYEPMRFTHRGAAFEPEYRNRTGIEDMKRDDWVEPILRALLPLAKPARQK